MKKSTEERRKEKPAFETLMPIDDEVKELLLGWKPPIGNEGVPIAFVLFEKREYELSEERVRKGTMCWNVDGRPDQIGKLRDYVLRKKFRVISYGNFPKANHPNPKVAAKAIMHTGPDKRNPWDDLEYEIKELMGVETSRTVEVSKLKEELRRKTEEVEALKSQSKTKTTKPETVNV